MRHTEKNWRVRWKVIGLEFEDFWACNPRDYRTTAGAAIALADKITERPGFVAEVQRKLDGKWGHFLIRQYTR